MPAWLSADASKNCRLRNTIGFDISASLPVQTAALADYGREELLGRYGGAANIYFNLLAGRDLNAPLFRWGDRRQAVDRIYILDAFPPGETVSANQALVFISHGIGVHAIKTQIQGSAFAAAGSAYLGIGADGPLYDVTQKPSDDTTGGGLSLELYGTANVVNPRTLNTLFKVTNSHSTYYAVGVNFSAGLPGKFSISVEYTKGIGAVGRTLGEVTMFNFSYNKPGEAKTRNGN
jgi:hypothetical protein